MTMEGWGRHGIYRDQSFGGAKFGALGGDVIKERISRLSGVVRASGFEAVLEPNCCVMVVIPAARVVKTKMPVIGEIVDSEESSEQWGCQNELASVPVRMIKVAGDISEALP